MFRVTLFDPAGPDDAGQAARHATTHGPSNDRPETSHMLFEEQAPGHTPSRPGHGRGLFMGPPVPDRPFFGFRA